MTVEKFSRYDVFFPFGFLSLVVSRKQTLCYIFTGSVFLNFRSSQKLAFSYTSLVSFEESWVGKVHLCNLCRCANECNALAEAKLLILIYLGINFHLLHQKPDETRTRSF